MTKSECRRELKFEFISAIQWKLLGQEKDGSILLGWVEEILSDNEELKSYSVIGRYDRLNNKLEVNYNNFTKPY